VTFEVGDKVIYPNHGLGVVQRIETKTILGTTCGFYQLRMVSNDTTVLVPVENADNVGLRKAVGDQEVDRLFGLLSDGKIDTHQNWKGRFKDNSDRMRTGSIFDVVEVLKSLTFLARSKNLSFREKRMLDRAKFLVVSEITEVTHEELTSVEERVEQALELCFTTKTRALARQATPLKASAPPPRPPVEAAAAAVAAVAAPRRAARAS
jgi:CarD family transcriptional regulator